MPLPTTGPSTVYAREQIPIPPYMLGLLKEYQKATLRHFRGRKDVPAAALLEFSQAYFGGKDAAAKGRLAREQQYRREWSDKEREVRQLFGQFDANGDGTIDAAEVPSVLSEVAAFFAEAMELAGLPGWAPQDDEGARSLLAQVDADAAGRVLWDDFWSGVAAWMDSNFARLEEARARDEASAAAAAVVERAAEQRALEASAEAAAGS